MPGYDRLSQHGRYINYTDCSQSLVPILKIAYMTTKADRNINPLNAELNSICYLLALLGAYHFLHVSRIKVKSLTLSGFESHRGMDICLL